MFSSSCAKQINSPPVVPCSPPAVYLQDVPIPAFRGTTNGDFITWKNDLEAAIKQSNKDKAALRDWILKQTP
jgi:hypothetical protein